jgi:hypothetical protein
MNWHQNVKERYQKEGWEAFRTAEKVFLQRLAQFCAEQNITILDDYPEGRDWLVLLKDGTELYVDRHSYDTDNEANDFLVDYDLHKGGVIVMFWKSKGFQVLIPNDEISEISNKWYSE